MERVQKQLMISFIGLMLLSILLVVAGESGIAVFHLQLPWYRAFRTGTVYLAGFAGDY
jgi:hypothetical protein